MKFSVIGVGAIGPGFSDWTGFQSALAAEPKFEGDTPPPLPGSISKRERARAPHLVKLAIVAAEQACAMSNTEPSELATVFSSCMSDTEVTDYMCRTLAENPTEMSPTKFHNSVHNAAAGYWTISNKAHMPATAISARKEYSCAMALVEAATQCQQEQVPVLLVVYDIVVPDILKCVMDIKQAAAFAMVISPDAETSGRIASLELECSSPAESDNSLAEQPLANPVSHIYPLFEGFALRTTEELRLPVSKQSGIVLRHL